MSIGNLNGFLPYKLNILETTYEPKVPVAEKTTTN